MVTKVSFLDEIAGFLVAVIVSLAPSNAAAQAGNAVIHVDGRIRQASCTNYAPATRECGSGTATAFRTLAGAAAAARPGTTVNIREGVYQEPLVPAASGTSGQPITFQGASGEAVVLSGLPDAVALQLIGRSFIVIRGFTVQDVAGWGRLQDATDNIVQEMIFKRATAGGTTGGLKLVRASGNRIVNNRFEEGNDSVLLQDNSNNNVVSGNLFSHARHSLLSIRCSGTNVIRVNTFDNPDQKAMEIYDCEGVSDAPVRLNSTLRNLIERNIFLRTHPSTRNYAYNAIQHGGQATNVRYNVFNGSAGGGVNFQYYERESLFVYGNRLNHNTFYANNCFAVVGVTGAPRQYVENRVINNLLYKNRDCLGGGDQISIADPQAVILIKNAIESQSPGFVNEQAGDFRLGQNSRVIDTAGPLTTTRSKGSGTDLPVVDPLPFFDGFGIAGEVGDEIQLIGSTERARIVRITLAPGTLTLDRPLTWENNQGVALAFTGAAPDPGAFEFGLSAPPGPPARKAPETPESLRVIPAPR